MEGVAAPPLALVNGIRIAATIAFALALPVFLVTNAVRSVTLDDSLYMAEFARYRVGLVTGLSDAELQRVAKAFVTYFQAEPGPMDVVVNTTSGPTPLFNDREIRHMEDVQILMRRVLRAWTVSLVVLVVAAVALIAVEPRTGAWAFFRAGAIGGATAVLVVGAVAGLAALDFERLFLQFHFLSFSNDLWMLDPSRDRLIQLFPEGFFFDAAMRIGLQTVGFGAAAFVASFGMLRALP